MIPLLGWILLLVGPASSPRCADDAVTLAFRDLYQVARDLTTDPSNGYEPGAPNNQWPYATDVKKKWRSVVTANGTSLTDQERKRIVPCAAHLLSAIDEMERGYLIKVGEPGNAGAQRSADSLFAKGRADFALCDEAYALGLTDSTRTALTGGVEATAPTDAQTPIQGSAEEAADPGSIDWTPYLDGFFQFMGSEWQRETVQWKYAASTEDNTVTVLLRRNQPPAVAAVGGSKASILNDIVQRAPTPAFPPGSLLNGIELVTPFYLGMAPTKNSPTNKLRRTRRSYYERNGVFKWYAAQ